MFVTAHDISFYLFHSTVSWKRLLHYEFVGVETRDFIYDLYVSIHSVPWTAVGTLFVDSVLTTTFEYFSSIRFVVGNGSLQTCRLKDSPQIERLVSSSPRNVHGPVDETCETGWGVQRSSVSDVCSSVPVGSLSFSRTVNGTVPPL